MKPLVALILLTLGAAACAGGDPLETIEESVFRVRGEGCRVANIGTAFAIEPDLLLTNAHVVAGVASDLVVTDASGTATTATIVAWDPIDDLALLEAPDLGAIPLELGPPVRGRGVLADARIEGELALLDIEVTRLVDIESGDIYDEGTHLRSGMEATGDIGPGSSGAPLIIDGLVVGAAFAEVRNGGIVFATSTIEIEELLAEPRMELALPVGRCRRR